MAGSSFTSSYDKMSNVLKNSVNVMPSAPTEGTPDGKEYIALWDTGATNSVITQKVVDELGLLPVSMGTAYTPQGKYDAWKYYVDLKLPNGVRIPKLLVMCGQPMGCDILIGMDVISRGDFAVSHFEGKTVFSFRIPTMMKIDFVEHSYLKPHIEEAKQGRNSPCKCGSGKKYKHCCGKDAT